MRRTSLFSGTKSAVLGLAFAAAVSGCGDTDDMNNNNNMMMPAKVTCDASKVMGDSSKLATDALKLPTAGKSYAYDMDGDGVAENQLKNLLNIVSSQINLQDSVNEAVTKGQAVLLFDVKSPSVADAMCTGLTIGLAKTTAMPPKYDGTDMFMLGDIMGVKLYGAIKAGKLATTAPKDQTAETEQKIEIRLPLGSGGMELPLVLHAAHIEGTVSTDGGVTRIKDGALHGVISKTDIDDKIVPLIGDIISKLINDEAKKDPNSNTIKTLVGLFEKSDASKKKCMADAMKCCATNPTTCKIEKQEIIDSPIGGVLSPDVEVFDAQGKWKPVAKGKNPNGMSVGLGFTSVKAGF